jgi:hypothetical protein
MENLINVTEFTNFETAFDAATSTKEMFEAFQTGSKKSIMKQYGKRFFVSKKKELYYVTECDLRLLHKAEVYSVLDNMDFEYVQIMIPVIDNPEMKGKLRFSGAYVPRHTGALLTKQMEVASFFK